MCFIDIISIWDYKMGIYYRYSCSFGIYGGICVIDFGDIGFYFEWWGDYSGLFS